MAKEPFTFEQKDFVLKAEKENAEARKKLMFELRKALIPNLSDNFKGTRRYVNDIKKNPQFGGGKEFRDHSWIGIHFKDIFPWQPRKDKHGKKQWLRDIPQFQVSLEPTGLSVLLNVDHSSHNIREVVHEVIKNQKNKCFDILKTLDPDVTVLVKTNNSGKRFTATLPTDKRMEWSISKLQLQDMDEIIKFLSRRGGQFRVGIQFSKSEAMKPSIVGELSNGLEKLYPLYMFLTKNNNSGGNGNSGNSGGSIDEKFKDWLERGARKDSKSIEEYAKDLGKEEIEDRHKRFTELKKVLDEEPIDLTKISTILEKAMVESWTSRRLLGGYFGDARMENAINALKEYKDETETTAFFDIMEQILPPGREDAGETQRLSGLETAGQLSSASVLLTSLHPDKFVDFRIERWRTLAKQIRIEEEFAPVINCSKEKRLEEVGKFAKTITDTPTFKKYWGNQQEPLWTLAGICWYVKGDKDEESDSTDMDELVEEILNKAIDKEDFKLAVEKNVVKRIIRHLRGGKDVVLVGAPGVGKTELATRVLSVVGKDMIGKSNFHPAVAHAEWTRRDVIGGLNLDKEFEPGCVTIAAENNQWLLIDEFNRADINKAFGEMFLGIESKKIILNKAEADARVRANKKEIIDIPEKFRMVCTMNDFDKNLLLIELSYGLITRFAFVDIIPDENKEVDSIKKQIGAEDGGKLQEAYQDCEKVIEKFYEFINVVRKNRMIGVRTCIDVIRYTVSASKKEGKDKVYQFLDEALCDYLWPQFDRLDKQVIKYALDLSEKHLPKANGFRKNLDRRYKELKKLAAWMGDDEPEAKDNYAKFKNLKSGGDGKKEGKPGKNPNRVAGGKRAWTKPPLLGRRKNTKKKSKKRGKKG